eukprot:jgi/Astpho2/2406/e_gw1.00044.68.1_t
MSVQAVRISSTLDRAAFDETLHLKALLLDKQQCHQLMQQFRGFTFDRPKMRCIVEDSEHPQKRLMLLSENISDLQGMNGDLLDIVHQHQLELVPHTVTIGYQHMSMEQVLKKALPGMIELPSSFESVGHIAHLNLRDELLPHKQLIAQVLLDKNPSIRTVVNKLGNIENEFRVFQMEVLAGEPSLETEVKQHKARFSLDFSKVYWNSRLEREHKRLVDTFKRSDVVVDVMAGIGPFAVPAAQKGCQVFANDLNPDSFEYLQRNIKLNRVQGKVQASNMDGRAFLRRLCQPESQAAAHHQTSSNGLEESLPSGPVLFQHAIMNLPASAVEFLDALPGAFDPTFWSGKLPQIHCYTFQKAPETDAGTQQRVEAALGARLPEGALNIHIVRNVAPNKHMLCLTFRVPEDVAFQTKPALQSNGNEPLCKKQKL